LEAQIHCYAGKVSLIIVQK